MAERHEAERERLDAVIPRGELRKLIRTLGERPRRENEAMLAQAETLLCDEQRLLERWWALLPDERRAYLQLTAYAHTVSQPEQRPAFPQEALRTYFDAPSLALIERLKQHHFLLKGYRRQYHLLSTLCPHTPTLPLERGEGSPFPPLPFFRILAEVLELVEAQALHLSQPDAPSADQTSPLTPSSEARLEAEGIGVLQGTFLLYHLMRAGVVEVDEEQGTLHLHGESLAAYLVQPEEVRLLDALLQLEGFLPPPLLPTPAEDFRAPRQRSLLDWKLPPATTGAVLNQLAIFSDGPLVPLTALGLEATTPALYLDMLLALLELLGMAERRTLDGVPQVRLRHLQRGLWGRRPPPPPPLQATTVHLEGKRLDLPPTAPAALHREVQRWATCEGLEGGRCRYRLDERRLDAVLASGERTEALAARWAAVGAEVPDALRRWWQQRERRYGRVRLYAHVDWLSTRDPLTLREIRLAVPELERWSEGEITPTDLLLQPERADALLQALRERGYLPREEG